MCNYMEIFRTMQGAKPVAGIRRSRDQSSDVSVACACNDRCHLTGHCEQDEVLLETMVFAQLT